MSIVALLARWVKAGPGTTSYLFLYPQNADTLPATRVVVTETWSNKYEDILKSQIHLKLKVSLF